MNPGVCRSVAHRRECVGALHEAVGLKHWKRQWTRAQHTVDVVPEELSGRS